MALDFSGVGKFLKGLNFLDGLGLADIAIGMASMIFDYAREEWEEQPSTQDVIDEIQKLSEQIDTLAPSIIEAVNDLINDQIIGVRMQQLASALSGAESARDLLASYRPGDDPMRSAIIVEASGAFRDTLAQAVAIATPSDAYNPSFSAINTAMASVMHALTTRLSVAATLEKNDMAADKIRNQVLDAADFFEDAIGYYREAMETRESSWTIKNLDGKTYYHFQVELDIDREFVDIGDGQFVRLPPFRFDRSLEQWQFPGSANKYLKQIERDLEDQAFVDLDMGIGGKSLMDLANNYRVLADGVEIVLPSRVGYDSSGTLTGTEGKDLLIGNDGDDLLVGGGSNDMLRGNDGDDKLQGDDGNDRLIGGAGNDTLLGGSGDDTMYGGLGKDVYDGGDGFDSARLTGQWFDYKVILPPGLQLEPLKLKGPDGTDTILSTVEALVFDSNTFAPVVGTNAKNELYGSTSDDLIFGFGGDDLVFGLDGDDIIFGHVGNDELVGGQGRDIMFGNQGDDKLWGEIGNDTLRGGTGNDGLQGQEGNDTLIGNAGQDTLFGQAGDDILRGGRGDDYMTGGDGNDVLKGNAGNDQLLGGSGDDWHYGGGGEDNIYGAGGDDVMKGGSGADTFSLGYFNSSPNNDVILDFKDDVDTIRLARSVGGGVTTAEGALAFAVDDGSDILFDFLDGNSLVLIGAGGGGTDFLLDDLIIV